METTIQPIEIEIKLNETEFLNEKTFWETIDQIDNSPYLDLEVKLNHHTGYKITCKIPYFTGDVEYWINTLKKSIRDNITNNPLLLLRILRDGD